MRVICSGISLAQQTHQELTIIWEKNDDLNADFLDLFNDNALFRVVDPIEKFKFLHHNYHPNFTKRLKAFFRNRLLGIKIALFEQDILPLNEEDRFKKLQKFSKKYSDIFIQTTQSFGNWKHNLNLFEFSNIINKRYKKYAVHVDSNTIGLHIRRGDHGLSRKYSTDRSFEKLLNTLNKGNKTSKIFLCTDDFSLRKKLTTQFSNIICFDHELNRNTKDGMINALLDLYTLSKCGLIYGSYWSSFSELAAHIGRVELKVVQDHNMTD